MDPPAPSLFQFQWDIGSIVERFVKALFNACADDGLQGAALPSVENFGAWIMVDSTRLSDGEVALRTRQSQKTLLPVAIAMPSTASFVARSPHATGAFLFAACCTKEFGTEKTGQLIHEMLLLKGFFNDRPISPRLVIELVEALNGCADFLPKDRTPAAMFDGISQEISRVFRQTNTWIDGLYSEPDYDMRVLAKVTHDVFDALQDEENQVVEIEGSRTGVWLATLFKWLRPEETDVFVGDYPISPTTEIRQSSRAVRLHIHLRQHNFSDECWKITRFREHGKLDHIIQINHDGVNLPAQHPSSWGSARGQVHAVIAAEPVVDAVGHLSGAFVTIATESGYLQDEMGQLDHCLEDLCSDWYKKTYNAIMVEKMGWKEHFDHERHRKLVAMIQSKMARREYEVDKLDDVDAIGRLISSCYGEYMSQHSEPMLVGPQYLDFDRDIVEHAINLAGQILVSSLHDRPISHATYWPTQPRLVKKFAMLIRDMTMIHPPREHESLQPPRRPGYPFWKFRELAVQSAFPSVIDVGATDLACAADGYVAYTNALTTGGAMKDDPAAMAKIHVVPGLLKWEEADSQYAQGKYVRVTEDPQRMNSKASRTVSNSIKSVHLLDSDEYLGVSEEDARNDLDLTIKHLVRRDERQKTLFLTTLLQETPRQSVGMMLIPPGFLELNIPTRWHRSIEVSIFAKRIRENTSSLRQLESLARDWAGKGYLDEGLQWCPVGQLARDGRRYITKTSSAAQLRFFEAGNVSEGRRVFIRQNKVPLGHCVKVAMDLCEDGPNWVIIS